MSARHFRSVKPLAAGARVALIAPAGPLQKPDELPRAEENARSLGWETIVATHDIYFALKSKQWPTAIGKVIDAEIVLTPAVRGSYTSPLVGYEYEVRGVRYTSNRIDYSGRGSSLGAWSGPTRDYLRRHREGEPVTVRYDPNEPKRAVLETGPTVGNFLRLLIGFAVLGLGLLSLLAS